MSVSFFGFGVRYDHVELDCGVTKMEDLKEKDLSLVKILDIDECKFSDVDHCYRILNMFPNVKQIRLNYDTVIDETSYFTSAFCKYVSELQSLRELEIVSRQFDDEEKTFSDCLLEVLGRRENILTFFSLTAPYWTINFDGLCSFFQSQWHLRHLRLNYWPLESSDSDRLCLQLSNLYCLQGITFGKTQGYLLDNFLESMKGCNLKSICFSQSGFSYNSLATFLKNNRSMRFMSIDGNSCEKQIMDKNFFDVLSQSELTELLFKDEKRDVDGILVKQFLENNIHITQLHMRLRFQFECSHLHETICNNGSLIQTTIFNTNENVASLVSVDSSTNIAGHRRARDSVITLLAVRKRYPSVKFPGTEFLMSREIFYLFAKYLYSTKVDINRWINSDDGGIEVYCQPGNVRRFFKKRKLDNDEN